jgi:hypothetical protein
MNIYKRILNENNGEQFYTGVVATINPLTVKFFTDDTAISVVPTSNLSGIAVGSKLVISKIDNQFFAVGIINNFNLTKCLLNKTDVQSIPTATFTKITFDATQEIYDPLSMHDGTTNNTRITIPTTGIYQINAGGRYESSTDGNARLIYIYINNAAINSVGGEFDSTGRFAGTNSVILNLSANDYVEMAVYQASGGNLNFGGTTYNQIHFSVIQI